MAVQGVPSDLPTVVFTDNEGATLRVVPANSTEAYFVSVAIGGESVWLSAAKAMALAQVLEKSAAAVGAISLLEDLPLISDEEREAGPVFTLA